MQVQSVALPAHLCCGVIRAADQQGGPPPQRAAAVDKVVMLAHLLHLYQRQRSSDLKQIDLFLDNIKEDYYFSSSILTLLRTYPKRPL